MKRRFVGPGLWGMAALLSMMAPGAIEAQATPNPESVRIDLDHILKGRVNKQGDLVGIHHAPSAPKSMTVRGRPASLSFERTSPGGSGDVRTARVLLRDPQSGQVVLEKFSTLYPDEWTAKDIEGAIREAYADARKNRKIDSRGRWEGRSKSGVRIDGFMSYDGRFIATAFPVYVRPQGGRNRR